MAAPAGGLPQVEAHQDLPRSPLPWRILAALTTIFLATVHLTTRCIT